MESVEERTSITVTPGYEIKHFWQDWRWILAIALFLMSIGMVFIGISQYRNNDVLDKLNHSNEQVDSLVHFVDCSQDPSRKDCPPPNTQQSETVQNIYRLLCATSDEARLIVCKQLGIEAPGG